MRTVTFLLVAGWAVTGTGRAAPASPLAVRHEPVRCMLAERYPQIDACIEPAQRLARARVYFRAEPSSSWRFVEMRPVGSCFRATLPEPQRTARRVHYYLVATDVLAGDSALPEVVATVVTDDNACPAGTAVGPFLSAAAVEVGGGGVPAGFVGSAARGAGLKVVGSVVGAGAIAAGVLLAHGSGSGGTGATADTSTTTLLPPITTTTTTTSTTTTTTRPPRHTTTTTTTPPPPPTTQPPPTTTTTSTTTTTTAPSGCAVDSAPPTVSIQQPRRNADVGAKVPITVEASDPGPVSSGMSSVRLYAQRVGGTSVVEIATLTGRGPSYSTTWTMPNCSAEGLADQEQWDIFAEAKDNCGRTSTASVRVRRAASSCTGSTTLSRASERTLVWQSELGVAGGRGQVVANGREAVFPPAGHSDLRLVPRAGENRVEAVLVDARGPGSWRFALSAGGIRPGTLRVLAGEVAAIGADTVTFRLHGRQGERVVFGFEAE